MQKNAMSYVTGFPRIGKERELKFVLESFWTGKCPFEKVSEVSGRIRFDSWKTQKDAGIDMISCNDFSLYDGMLDTAVMLGAIPERFLKITKKEERYFAMARGNRDCLAMEMTKWFNTNYHYIVPELSKGYNYEADFTKITGEYLESQKLGYNTKINVIGPLTFLLLSKRIDSSESAIKLLPEILPIYRKLLMTLDSLNKEIIVQFDEPWFVKDCGAEELELLPEVYRDLSGVSARIKLVVMTYFDSAVEAVKKLKNVNLWGVGLDFVHGAENINALKDINGKNLIAGIVNGRNIWKNDMKVSLKTLSKIASIVPRDNIILSTSCSLLHVPYSLEYEKDMDPEIRSWMSFAQEKLLEVSALSEIFFSGKIVTDRLTDSIKTMEARKSSKKVNNPDVKKRIDGWNIEKRKGSYPERIKKQKEIIKYPMLPTTTIGSLPQTEELRLLRNEYRKGLVADDEYNKKIKLYIDRCIEFQEKIGLDVLVHGEPERNDMVEYFGEKLSGFAFTENGWVQSYGSRCVKPPVIYGDVERPKKMTVDTIKYAQSRTKKIVKGMLTGPVTILNWSFVREDKDKGDICKQIAVALYDEISDLQDAGIKIIQVDEAAFKEGYPLKKEKAKKYEAYAVKCFRIAVSCAKEETQIHTHMCYSDFGGILNALKKMDADVITIETSRSGNKLLNALNRAEYKNDIGPGVYDIHSPRVPSVQEFEEKIKLLLAIFPASRLWINPDCGLKTRGWEETEKSLLNMVAAAKKVKNSM
jgi:5-methyltetrahydropteroyltriglutamate--homocysteine methyltransferase